MSDSQKVSASLNLLLESCNAAISALSEDATDITNYPTSNFSTLRSDYISLLSILYAATTKVALSLKPSSPQHKASLVPLKDLTNNVAALVHSVRLMRCQEGTTVVKEYESTSQDTIMAIRSLAQTLQSSSSNSTASEEYLMRAGGVHEIIEIARKSGGLSLNNRDAVRKIWLRDHDSLVDGAEEIKEICEPTEAEDLDDDELIDDGWEELGISSNQKLSPIETQRAEKVQAIVKLGILLHKRIIKDTLSTTSSSNDNALLDRLAGLSDKLLMSSDDLISSMYPPQQLPNVTSYLESFQDIIREIQAIILPSLGQTLEDQLDSLSIANSRQATDKPNKWFTTCFDQIDKARANLSGTLSTPNGSSP